jgi:hypothetical protein
LLEQGAEALESRQRGWHIGTHLKNEPGLMPSEKNKYVWKMLYIYFLGYDVDFGHMEILSLILLLNIQRKRLDTL